MTWIALGAFFKRIGSAVWGWLNHATAWQLIALGLGLFALVQHFELAHTRREAANYKTQRDGYKRQLDAISTKRNEQKVITQEKIRVVTRTIKAADEKAKVIEAAPLPGNCRTPGGDNADL